MKLNEKALANALAIFMGLVYVLCALFVTLLPDLSRLVATSWFHGIDLSLIWTGEGRPNFVLGLISAVGLSWLSGWAFASTYNKLAK